MPMIFMAATGVDTKVQEIYRKPSPHMFYYLEKNFNSGIKFDLEKSTYCGDAAGRAATATRKKDHSNDDRQFAANCKLKFFTPEAFFLGEHNEA